MMANLPMGDSQLVGALSPVNLIGFISGLS